jgi:hypothetical protein
VPSKWSNRFELKPGRWVYVPTPEARSDGADIKRRISALWEPPEYYYHAQRGGHVAAIRSHLENSRFVRFDIQDFFGSINRTRVTRCLKSLVPYSTARAWATASTVRDPLFRSKAHIPYGFVQSQLLASICLFRSALGKYLHRIHGRHGILVSVYVDDVIVSARDTDELEMVYAEIQIASARSKLILSPSKSTAPAAQVSAFNILLSEASMSINPERLAAFSAALAAGSSDSQRIGILRYVESVCPQQLGVLETQ